MTVGFRLRRHPIPMVAHFRHSVVVAYALPAEVLAPLVPPGLLLDTYGEVGFVAIALVQAEDLRPAGLPPALGADFFLTGYRIFVRHVDGTGRIRRGLHILRSDTDRRSMVLGGNALTHYRYRLATIRCTGWPERPDRAGNTGPERPDRAGNTGPERLEVEIRTPSAEADLHVVADIGGDPAALPPGSPFSGTSDARRFAGPLPWTFDHEPETSSIVVIRGRRSEWHPKAIAVEVKECTFFDDHRFAGATPVLANAFHVEDLDYRWDRGVRMGLAS